VRRQKRDGVFFELVNFKNSSVRVEEFLALLANLRPNGWGRTADALKLVAA